jgi:hypothetical protein
MQPGVGYRFSSSSSGITLDIGDPWPDNVASAPCPFTIVDASFGTTYQFSCVPGMVNSVIPQIGIAADPTKRLDQIPVPTTTFNFDASTGYSYIYLKVSALGPPTEYPVNDPADILYPRIISTSMENVATDVSAYFLLATAYQHPTTKVITIWQLTCGSQWSDRIKVGTATALYYFARS